MGPTAIPALGRAATKGSVSDVQDAAIDALASAGKPALSPLIEVLKEQGNESQMRRKALAAIQAMGPADAASAVPVLADVVKNPKTRGDARLLRQDAVAALGALAKPSDTAAITVLNDIINDEKNRDMGLKNQCRQAVKRIMSRK
jgi:HEAT repeat protein